MTNADRLAYHRGHGKANQEKPGPEHGAPSDQSLGQASSLDGAVFRRAGEVAGSPAGDGDRSSPRLAGELTNRQRGALYRTRVLRAVGRAGLHYSGGHPQLPASCVARALSFSVRCWDTPYAEITLYSYRLQKEGMRPVVNCPPETVTLSVLTNADEKE